MRSAFCRFEYNYYWPIFVIILGRTKFSSLKYLRAYFEKLYFSCLVVCPIDLMCNANAFSIHSFDGSETTKRRWKAIFVAAVVGEWTKPKILPERMSTKSDIGTTQFHIKHRYSNLAQLNGVFSSSFRFELVPSIFLRALYSSSPLCFIWWQFFVFIFDSLLRLPFRRVICNMCVCVFLFRSHQFNSFHSHRMCVSIRLLSLVKFYCYRSQHLYVFVHASARIQDIHDIFEMKCIAVWLVTLSFSIAPRTCSSL